MVENTVVLESDGFNEVPMVASEVGTTPITQIDEQVTDMQDTPMSGEDLKNAMMSNTFTERQKGRQIPPLELTDDAKDTPWFIVRHLFDETVSEIISAAQSAVVSKNWTALETIEIPVTINENSGKYCCWECGGAKHTFGHALIIGEPSGNKPLAISAFRKCNIPNGKQAVIHIWPSCVVAISTQSRGIGATLLYKATGVKVKESIYVQPIRGRQHEQYTEGAPVKHFTITCQLNKVFNMATDEVRQFYNDLNHIDIDSDIIKAAVRKSTIYNCDQAIFIRPFYKVRDGVGDWNMDALMVENSYIEPDEVSSRFMEILADLSTLIRKMPNKSFPHVGLQVLQRQDEDSVLIKIAILTTKKCRAWNLCISKELFFKHRDFFMVKSYEHLLELVDERDTAKKTFIYKYAGN